MALWSSTKMVLRLAIFVVGLTCVTCLVCPQDEYNLEGKKCCKQCAPGYGVSQQCSETNNGTMCQMCEHGKTFSSALSHETRCEQCTVCPSSAHPKRACNVTHNTVCECNKNYYFDTADRWCKLCDTCPKGWSASTPCSPTTNTKCKPCPNGTFSEVESNTGSHCKPCSICAEGKVTLQECSPKQDTVCMGKLDVPVGPDHTTPAYTDGKSGSNTGAELIPLYCAIMGLVIVALLAYAIYKHWKMRGKKRRDLYEKNEENNKPHGSDSGVYTDSDNKNLMALKLCDLPVTKKKELEVYLTKDHNGQNWTNLARELGYNASIIENIESRAMRENQVPVRCLLIEWGKSDNATVGNLIKALKTIDRQDAVKIIYGQMNKAEVHCETV